MPYRDPEAKRTSDRDRRDKIKADPARLKKRRAQGRAAQKKYRATPEGNASTKAAQRRWREHGDNGLDAHVKSKFGISAEEYGAMLRAQDGRCAICRRPETVRDPKQRAVRRLCVDHCHVTGMVRALLCYRCNAGIGMFHDDPARLEAAAAYVRAFQDVARPINLSQVG